MVDWTPVLVALAVGLPGTIAAIGALLMSYHNSNKIDNNTEITKAGAVASATGVRVAEGNARIAKEAAEFIKDQLNGALDDRVETIVKKHTDPLLKAFKEHNACDEMHMTEIKKALAELKEAVHPSKAKAH